MAELTAKDVRRVLHYDPATGVFIWRVKTAKKVVVGAQAGGLNVAGYVVISVLGQTEYAHRLAWLYMTGERPDIIDHADGNRSNNRWSNLRSASMSQNILNAKIAKNNTSGHKGVSWHKAAGKWSATVWIDGVQKYLGLYETVEDAGAAYEEAVKLRHPEFLRLK